LVTYGSLGKKTAQNGREGAYVFLPFGVKTLLGPLPTKIDAAQKIWRNFFITQRTCCSAA
jgi:hypothetical protein